jgi:hypothetical protein
MKAQKRRLAHRGYYRSVVHDVSFLVFALISRELSLKNITVYDFLIGIAVGALSGILTVNIKSLRKILDYARGIKYNVKKHGGFYETHHIIDKPQELQ